MLSMLGTKSTTRTMTTATLPPKRRQGPKPYRFTVAKYHRMIEAGVLTENDPVELLEGRLVRKMPRDPAHDGTLGCWQSRIQRLLNGNWVLRIQSAITTKDSEPEPDLVIAEAPLEKYFKRHPRAADIALVGEVANTTLDHDRHVKGRIYARDGIETYWLVNLIERCIEVYRKPKGGKTPEYLECTVYHAGDSVPVAVRGKQIGRIAVSEILPPV